jgi:type IV pilus assembly protein PilM
MFGTKNPIGVDLGSHSVKVCQLKRVGDAFELEKFGRAEIDADGERSTDPRQQHEHKVEALKRALAEGQIKARQTVSAVSGESIIVRYLQLPEMPDNELRKAMQWEAEEYIPFRLSEVNLDSMILGRVNDGDHPKMDVLLVSAKKDLVQQHVSILQAAGLEPVAVDVDSFAFLNCFEANHQPRPDECIALVNIGNGITNINVYSSGVSRFSRDIAIGGEAITTAIRSRLGCSFTEAERLKIGQGATKPTGPGDGEPDATVGPSLLSTIRGTMEQELGGADAANDSPEALAQAAVMHCLQSLFMEVRRSVEFFENQYRGQNIARLVLGGGTAILPNLAENFHRELGLPVETIDPLRRVHVAAKPADADRIQAIRHQLGVGIGLGIRGLAA